MDYQRAAFAGQIEDLPVAELIRMTVHGGQSGVARFETPRGVATLWFSNGEVVDAQMGRFHLENALTRLLDVQTGSFEVEYRPITRRRLIDQPTLDLLAEWEREQGGLEPQPAGPRHRASRKKSANWFPTGGGASGPAASELVLQQAPRVYRSTEMAEMEQASGIPGASETGTPGSIEDAVSGAISVGVTWEAPTPALRPSSETIHSGQAASARGVIDPEAAPGPTSTETQTYLSRDAVRRPSVDVVWRPRAERAAAADPAIVEPPASTEQPGQEPASASGPALVGRYEVLLRLARGGMGTVYLCRVTGQGGFRRLFALKVIRDHLSRNDEYVKMLLQEARIASRLHHPNVVSIVDIGVLASQHYLVMDYVEGCTFSELLKAHPRSRPPHLVLPVVLDALAGLHAAHTLTDDDGQPLTLVHCDFSPQNMLIGTNGICRITDFGVARAVDALPDRKTRGKPGYLAPEQIRGRDFDHRADLFAAGVVLWNALTGETLFAGDSTEEILDQVLYKEIPPPSEVGLRPPTWLDEICLRALERDPEHRYQSAEEMFMDLRNVAIDYGLLAPANDVAQWVLDSFGPQLQLRRQAAGLAPAAAPRPQVQVPELGLGSKNAEVAESDEVDMGPGDSGSRTTVLHAEMEEDEPEYDSVLSNERRRRNGVLLSMAAVVTAMVAVAFTWPEMLRGGYVDEQGAYLEYVPDAIPAAAPAPKPTEPEQDEGVPAEPVSPLLAPTDPEAERHTPLLDDKDAPLSPELPPQLEAKREVTAPERTEAKESAPPAPATKVTKNVRRATPLQLPSPADVPELEPAKPAAPADDWEVKKIEAPPPLVVPPPGEGLPSIVEESADSATPRASADSSAVPAPLNW